MANIWPPVVTDFKNGDLSAEMKIVSGKATQTGGLIWRYQDPNNYYVFKLRNDGFYRVERRIAGATAPEHQAVTSAGRSARRRETTRETAASVMVTP